MACAFDRVQPRPPATVRVSAFGKYSGYSEPVYDGWVRSSRYVTVLDGTRLAVDLFRPARGGKAAQERLPVVWTHTPYRRAVQEGGTVYTILDTYGWLKDVLRHGYVVACVDARGTGVSFGTFDGMFNAKETLDSYDITEWLASQSWSDGNVGMYGQSDLAITQYLAASRKPPHLRAIFPSMGVADVYDFVYKGGIDHTPLIAAWSERMRQRDRDEPAAVPVDEDTDRRLLRAALAQHRGNRNAAEIFAALPHRDSLDAVSGAMPFRDWAPITFLREIRESKVAIYHLWISASAPDVDVFVYLEDVDDKGFSRYVSEGALRASHRATADPGYDLVGLPYHRGLRTDRADLIPGQPAELVIDLFPTSTLFQPGHRIRITLTGADKANTRAAVRTPPPRLTVWRDAGRGSFIELPVIPAGAQ